MNRQTASSELMRLKALADAFESESKGPQRSFLYSTSPSGNERDRKYIFGGGVHIRDMDAALAYMRSICRDYGIDI